MIRKFGLEEHTGNIRIIEPIDYLKLMGLTEKCFKVITDSGGYQKEAYFAGKSAIVIMPDTSWRELTDHGLNRLTDHTRLYENTMDRKEAPHLEGIYGEGDASVKIIDILIKDWKKQN